MKQPSPPKYINLMIGVAGHIDHGKTELVKMLTGCETDRLREEKERGMSIEVGYAPCFLHEGRIGIVDVPGHEKFVRKMVAGATGIDAALLVVAADDGVMPQTEEHLDVLELLGVRDILVVISKIDLVDDLRIDEVREQVRNVLQATPYAGADTIPLSSITGEGFSLLRKALARWIDTMKPREAKGVFRLPVDRVFSSEGYGTVITGIASAGTVAPGDRLEVYPIHKEARVRGVQVYLSDSERGSVGQCVALNLANIHREEIERGMLISTPGCLKLSKRIGLSLQASRFLGSAITQNMRVRFHVGTMDIGAKLRLLVCDNLTSGGSGFGQVELEQPASVCIGDRFILRLESPARTIAGGIVLETEALRYRKQSEADLKRLQVRSMSLNDDADMAVQIMHENAVQSMSISTLAGMFGWKRDEAHEVLQSLCQSGKIVALDTDAYLSCDGLQQACNRIEEALKTLHETRRECFSFSRQDIQNETRLDDAVFQYAITAAIERKAVQPTSNGYRLAAAVSVDPTIQQCNNRIEAILYEERFQTSSPEEMQKRLRVSAAEFQKSLKFLCDSGAVIRLSDKVYLHREHVEWAKQQLVEAIEKDGAFETHKFKDVIQSSRKYAIPILDHFDAIGLTRRVGGTRELCR